MCGTANHNNFKPGHGHHHLWMSMADSAAYKYLANNETTTATKATTAMSTEHPPAVEKIDLKKPNDTLMTVMMTVTKSTMHKCTSFFGDVQKSQAYK